MIKTNALDQSTQDFLGLAACALSGSQPKRSDVQQMDLKKLYALGKFHSMSAIIYMALESVGAFADGSDLMQDSEIKQLALRWREQRDQAIRKIILLDAQRQKLCHFMDQNGIWYMPLKGIILKTYYPKIGMRQMADNDILFDADAQMKIKSYMVDHGYTVVSVGKSNHDVYEKLPVYNFEMHTALYGPAHNAAWTDYYGHIKERLIPDDGPGCGYHFSVDDFYVYLISHAYKHYDGSGTGVRSLMDIYVYLMKHRKELNRPYIEQELSKLGLRKFEAQSRTLSLKLFSPKQAVLSEEEIKQLMYFMGSGTYGTMANRVENKLKGYQPEGTEIKNRTRFKYMWKRLFPNHSWYEQFVPVVAKHRWMIPFFLIYRFARGITVRQKKIRHEIKLLFRL